MNRYAIYAAGVVLSVATIWLYGSARYDAGYAAATAEQAAEVARIEREMDTLRREANGRIAAKESEITKKEADYREKLSRLRAADDSFRTWLEIPVHPAAVDLIRSLHDETSGGAMPPGRRPGARTTIAITAPGGN